MGHAWVAARQRDCGYMRGRRTSTGVAPRAPPSGTATRRREPGGGEPPRAVAADHRALPQRDRGYMRGLRTSTGVAPRAPPSGMVRQRALLPCRTATPHAWCTRRQGGAGGGRALLMAPHNRSAGGEIGVFSVVTKGIRPEYVFSSHRRSTSSVSGLRPLTISPVSHSVLFPSMPG